MRRGGAFDLWLALALLSVLVANLPLMPDRILPAHDSFYNFANFHIFYSEFFFHGDLGRWYPYGTFGLQSDLEQIASLSPFSYLAGLVGALLRVRDAMLLFKLGAIGEQLAFVFGVHLLGRRLFAARATTFVLCLSAAGSTVWSTQQWWDFRFFALLPLTAYFLVSFLQERRPASLWLAGVTGVAWMLGLPPYLLPVVLLTLVVFFLVAAGRELPALIARLASFSRGDVLAFLAFAAVAAAYGAVALHALDHTSLHAPGRDPITGRVDAETFRTYGGNADLAIVAKAFLFAWPMQLPWGITADNSVYIGLLPLAGFVLALARERGRIFLGLVTAAGVLILLSLGGAFTRFSYHLPGFAYYRHVGLVYGLVKILVLIASGYGVERILRMQPPPLPDAARRVAALVLTLTVAAVVVYTAVSSRGAFWISSWAERFWARLGIYGVGVAASSIGRIGISSTFAMCLVLDLALFQATVYEYRVAKLGDRGLHMLQATEVRDLHYQAERRDRPELMTPLEAGDGHLTRQRAFQLTRVMTDVYWYVYQFANLDPCRSRYRTDYLPAGVDLLLDLQREQGLRIDARLACNAPKLRLATEVRFAESVEEARAAIAAALASGASTTVIRPPAQPRPIADATATAASRLEVTAFTLRELRVRLDPPSPGAWLVYADAHHPGWHASVDGHETRLHEADLAFKAVWLAPGAREVRFWFDRGLLSRLSELLALFGAGWALALLVWMAVLLRRPVADVAPAAPR